MPLTGSKGVRVWELRNVFLANLTEKTIVYATILEISF